jgi:hypothetical protein
MALWRLYLCNPHSLFISSIWLTCLPQNGLVKSFNDLSMPSHTTIGIPHCSLYLVGWSTKFNENFVKNAYAIPSLLGSSNGTNSNHFEKCSMITKTYKLCQGVKFNGLTKSKLHQYLSPIIGNGCKWGVGTLNDA